MIRRVLLRLGYVSLGLVYAVLGILATRAGAVALFGGFDRVKGFPAAFRYLLARRDGQLILGSVAAGLIAFTIARALDAGDARRASRLARIFAGIDALAHGVLAWIAIALLLRLKRGLEIRQMLAWVLEQFWGSDALKLAGIVVMAIGGFQIWQALTGKLRLLPSRKVGSDTARLVIRVGRFGYASRGAVSAIIGWFLFRVGRELDPKRYRDIGGALNALQEMRFGPLLLGLAGLGLAAYGAYLAFVGFFRRKI